MAGQNDLCTEIVAAAKTNLVEVYVMTSAYLGGWVIRILRIPILGTGGIEQTHRELDGVAAVPTVNGTLPLILQ